MLLMLIAELHAVVDTTLVPIELSQTMQGLHMLEMLGYDDDGADEVGVNDIDIHQNSPNNDYQLGGSLQLQHAFMPSLLTTPCGSSGHKGICDQKYTASRFSAPDNKCITMDRWNN